jgi:hypothetical protein
MGKAIFTLTSNAPILTRDRLLQLVFMGGFIFAYINSHHPKRQGTQAGPSDFATCAAFPANAEI